VPLIGIQGETRSFIRARSLRAAISTPNKWPQPTSRRKSTKALATLEPSINGSSTMSTRQTMGFVESLLQLIGLDWSVPDFSTLCRRQEALL